MYTKLTLLHSNDMHGDFLEEAATGSGTLIGGLARLSGYINRVRAEEENVLYLVSGDMLQGSVIDTEYRGISTIEMMNYLAPDAVTLGNHEFDYGLTHLLFLEKVANFPIVNANLYIRGVNKRLMRPYTILQIAGCKVLLIGVITDKVLQDIRKQGAVGSFITLEEASIEIGKIIAAHRRDDIDLTVIMTHIGHESDCELASMLPPEWGVDLIIGGHSHTVLERPDEVNGILVAQAGVGTDQIGRYDLELDTDRNCVANWRWQLVPIDEHCAEPDRELEAFISGYHDEVQAKYNTLLVKLATRHTHPHREIETSLGNLLADCLADAAGLDMMLLGSGSVRSETLGPVVTLGQAQTCFPYADKLVRCSLTGAQLERVFAHWMRPDNRTGEGECYQVSGRWRALYDNAAQQLVSLECDGQAVDAERVYTVGIQGYQIANSLDNLNLSAEELASVRKPFTYSADVQSMLFEYLGSHQNLARNVEGRLTWR
ncbi:MAG: bifunctional metallophosphatase/5'-nucleotidase [Chloroflexi bacterium]|nr:bifunctional metallophosphatase/5'-nucleotidase [Chloroflexota bacterium]